MTLAVVVMIGAGILLVVSAIENSSLIDTFTAIWSHKALTGLSGGSSSTGSTNGSGKTAPPGTKKS